MIDILRQLARMLMTEGTIDPTQLAHASHTAPTQDAGGFETLRMLLGGNEGDYEDVGTPYHHNIARETVIALDMRSKGYSMRQIGEYLGVSSRTVYRRIKKLRNYTIVNGVNDIHRKGENITINPLPSSLEELEELKKRLIGKRLI